MRVVLVGITTLCLVSAAASAQTEATTAPPGDPAVVPAPAAPTPTAPPGIRPAPNVPTLDELDGLQEMDINMARPLLRRLARTAEDQTLRVRAIHMLTERDPTRATARICGRVLRIDPDPLVRRQAAECLGRLPEPVASPQSPILVAALQDPDIDVVTMAGWALSNIGQPETLGAVAGKVQHDDRRVGGFFLDYADRLKDRHGLTYRRATYNKDKNQLQVVPPPGRLIAQARGLEVAASSAWVGLYGGMAGWLHGGLFMATYGGPVLESLSPLGGLTGFVAGTVAGATYAFFRADDLVRAQTVVQLGVLGTLAGYGLGALSTVGPEAALNMSAFGLAGTMIGTGFGVLLNETRPPSAGALALGATVAFSTAVGFGGIALSSRFDMQGSAGVAMIAAGGAGALTTIAVGPNEIGILPCVGGVVGGAALGVLAGAVTGMVETFQLQTAPFPFTEGSGWAVAGGYATGAVIGSTLTLLAPKSWDPLLTGDFELDPPTISAVAEKFDNRRPVPVASLGGRF